MYSLTALFFILPLYFSHVLSPFGLIFWESYSFERQKIYLLSLFLIICMIEVIVFHRDDIMRFLRKNWYIFLWLSFIPIFSLFYYWGLFNNDFLIGSYEKHHGYIFYLCILLYSIFISSGSQIYIKKYLHWSIVSACIVSIIAIWEQLGGGWDIYNHSEMNNMYPGRSLSTLGNPNYLAGYLILFIPILIERIRESYWEHGSIFYKKSILQIGILSIFLGGIFTSWSYIAMMILIFLFIWYYICYFFSKYSFLKKLSIFLFLCVMLLCAIFSFLHPDKILSFESRFILMKEVLSVSLTYPSSLFLGVGPDTILPYFSDIRSPIINSYFPSSMNIDSSHNLFIDILFQYGIIPMIFFLSLFRNWKSRTWVTPYLISIIAWLAFLMLNVFVIVHILIIILLFNLFLQEKNH